VLADKAEVIGGKSTFRRLREREGYGGINKARVTRLLVVLEHEHEIGTWRAGLTDHQRFAWSSPESILNRATDANGRRLFPPKKPTKAKPAAKAAEREVAELRAELAAARSEYVLDGDAREIAARIIGGNAELARAIAEEILDQLRLASELEPTPPKRRAKAKRSKAKSRADEVMDIKMEEITRVAREDAAKRKAKAKNEAAVARGIAKAEADINAVLGNLFKS
jgi:hypothetical protein